MHDRLGTNRRTDFFGGSSYAGLFGSGHYDCKLLTANSGESIGPYLQFARLEFELFFTLLERAIGHGHVCHVMHYANQEALSVGQLEMAFSCDCFALLPFDSNLVSYASSILKDVNIKTADQGLAAGAEPGFKCFVNLGALELLVFDHDRVGIICSSIGSVDCGKRADDRSGQYLLVDDHRRAVAESLRA